LREVGGTPAVHFKPIRDKLLQNMFEVCFLDYGLLAYGVMQQFPQHHIPHSRNIDTRLSENLEISTQAIVFCA
jgi:hypothetical protein